MDGDAVDAVFVDGLYYGAEKGLAGWFFVDVRGGGGVHLSRRVLLGLGELDDGF